MAGSRLEKIGTIYTRTTGLIKSKALSWQDRPLWYDIYEAFPPKEEPKFDRPAPNIPIRHIFYEEDKIRALFHKHNKSIGATNLSDSRFKSVTQRFIEYYCKIEEQYAGNASKEQIYQEAMDLIKKDRETRSETSPEESVSLSSEFKAAESEKVSQIKLKDIFKDLETPKLKLIVKKMGNQPVKPQGDAKQQIGIFPSIINETSRIVDNQLGKTFNKSDWLNKQVFLKPSVTYNSSLDLSYSVIMHMSTCIERVSDYMQDICFELSTKTDILPDAILEILKTDDETIDEESLIRSNIIEFVVSFVYGQNLVLEYLKQTLKEHARDIIKQMTVSNGLKNITPQVYRVLTWIIVQYLIDHKLIDEHISSDSVLIYFTMIFGHMTKIYNMQCVPSKAVQAQIASTKVNDRNNRTRDNFRAMKKWRVHLENILEHKKTIEEAISQAEYDEDALTIDTSILKENDCLVQCCTRRRTRRTDPDI